MEFEISHNFCCDRRVASNSLLAAHYSLFSYSYFRRPFNAKMPLCKLDLKKFWGSIFGNRVDFLVLKLLLVASSTAQDKQADDEKIVVCASVCRKSQSSNPVLYNRKCSMFSAIRKMHCFKFKFGRWYHYVTMARTFTLSIYFLFSLFLLTSLQLDGVHSTQVHALNWNIFAVYSDSLNIVVGPFFKFQPFLLLYLYMYMCMYSCIVEWTRVWGFIPIRNERQNYTKTLLCPMFIIQNTIQKMVRVQMK